MCEPTLIFAATTALAVVGGVVQYKASKNATAFNDQMAKTNIKVADAQAVDAERLGQVEVAQRRLQTRMQLASQQVGFAAQNVETTGTALDIFGNTGMIGENDENQIRANTARHVFGYRMKAYDINAQNQLQKYQGKVDRLGTILTTAGSVVGAYGDYRTATGGASWGSKTKSSSSGGGYGIPTGFGG